MAAATVYPLSPQPGGATAAASALKFILAHPAVICVTTETADPEHARENIAAGLGRLPDVKTRRRMLKLMRDIA